MQRTDSSEKTLMLGKTEGKKGGKRGWEGWMASPIQWTGVWANSETVKDRESWHAVVHGVTKSWTWLSHWTTTTRYILKNGIAMGKIFENYVIDKRLISKTCKKSIQINMKKKINKWAEDLNRPFSKDDIQLSNCCSVTKSCPTFVCLHKL